LKKFEKPIKKTKIENLATLLQLTPLVGFLAITSFQLKYWLVLETLPWL
jgi:hypothetical protein